MRDSWDGYNPHTIRKGSEDSRVMSEHTCFSSRHSSALVPNVVWRTRIEFKAVTKMSDFYILVEEIKVGRPEMS